MRKILWITCSVLIAAMALFVTGCKSSGMAVTGHGQIVNLDIVAPTDMPEGDTREVAVSVANAGVKDVKDLLFEVAIPSELAVQSFVADGNRKAVETMDSQGRRTWTWSLGSLNPTEVFTVTYHVQGRFGQAERTGDIRARAWAESLPGDKLVETKFIKVQR